MKQVSCVTERMKKNKGRCDAKNSFFFFLVFFNGNFIVILCFCEIQREKSDVNLDRGEARHIQLIVSMEDLVSWQCSAH